MISPSPSFIAPSLFLLLLTILGAPVSSLALPQEKPRRSPQNQQDREGVRPPVVYLMVAGSRPGIVAGIVMGPPPAFGLRPDLVQAFHAAASLKRMRVVVTIYPDRANYIPAELDRAPGGRSPTRKRRHGVTWGEQARATPACSPPFLAGSLYVPRERAERG